MMKKTIKYQKELYFFLLSIICSINLVTGCGRNEIVFETDVSEQVEESVQTMEQTETQTLDSEKSVKQTDSLQVAEQTGSVQNRAEDEGIQNTEVSESTVSLEYYVDVCGAVVMPGVYKVYAGTRIYEVIILAGGLTQEAEQSCINQALPVYDGMKLIVPTKEEWEAGEFVLDENEMIVRADKMQTSVSVKEESDGLININEATVEELCTLPGVGSTKAESIVAYREENGKFSSIEDIKKVAGIKEGLFEKIKSKIKV